MMYRPIKRRDNMCNYCCNNSNYCSRCNNCSNDQGWYNNNCRREYVYRLPTIVNPQNVNLNRVLAYYINPAIAGVASNGIIPLSLANAYGMGITPSGNGVILQEGVYKVSYALDMTDPAAAGVVSAGVSVNGVNQPLFTQSETIAAAGDLANLASSGLISINTPNSILNLVNTSGVATDITNANLVVEKVA